MPDLQVKKADNNNYNGTYQYKLNHRFKNYFAPLMNDVPINYNAYIDQFYRILGCFLLLDIFPSALTYLAQVPHIVLEYVWKLHHILHRICRQCA